MYALNWPKNQLKFTSTKGLETQRLIGSAVAGFNHARVITKASARKVLMQDKMIITKEFTHMGA